MFFISHSIPYFFPARSYLFALTPPPPPKKNKNNQNKQTNNNNNNNNKKPSPFPSSIIALLSLPEYFFCPPLNPRGGSEKSKQNLLWFSFISRLSNGCNAHWNKAFKAQTRRGHEFSNKINTKYFIFISFSHFLSIITTHLFPSS